MRQRGPFTGICAYAISTEILCIGPNIFRATFFLRLKSLGNDTYNLISNAPKRYTIFIYHSHRIANKYVHRRRGRGMGAGIPNK